MPPRAPAFRTAACRRYLHCPSPRVPLRLHPAALHTRQLRPQLYGFPNAERVLTAHYTTPTMAYNASSHNVAGEKTGPTTAPPPALSDDVKKDLLDAAAADGSGQSVPGRENEKGVEKKEKSAKELKKERKKAEKDAKFKAKKAAQSSGGAAGATKEGAAPKEKKKKGKEEEQLPEYVEETPKGEKKRLQSLDGPFTKAYIPKVVESAWCEYPTGSMALQHTDTD
jgi:homospermidine synthase